MTTTTPAASPSPRGGVPARSRADRMRQALPAHDPNRVDLMINLHLDDEPEPAAYLEWCLIDGSKFCGSILDAKGVRGRIFTTIDELCLMVGIDASEGFTPWHFGRAYKKGGGDIEMLPVVEPGKAFDGRALLARSREHCIATKNMFAPKKKAAAASLTSSSCFKPLVLAKASGRAPATQTPVPSFVVGSASKRAHTRKRAEAVAATDAAMGATAPEAITTAHITTTVIRAKPKRQREPRSLSCPGTPRDPFNGAVSPQGPVFEYETALDMFAHWYDGKHAILGCDESLDARTVWETVLPAKRSTKGKRWCRAYWEQKHARDYEEAYEKRANWVAGADGKWKRIDMAAPGVPTTQWPTDRAVMNTRGACTGDGIESDDDQDGNCRFIEEGDDDRGDDRALAMAFFSDAKGATVTAPHKVAYALWDQALMDRWFRRSTRSLTYADDPAIEAIVGRRWAFGTHMRYLCAWARPDTGVNARRIVRASHKGPAECRAPDTPTTWHAAAVLCSNPRYREQIRAYDAALRQYALSAADTFIARMRASGHEEDLISILSVEVRIALYRLGILCHRVDGPPPASPCVFPPGYCMATRAELATVAPPQPVRVPTIRLIARDRDANRAYNTLMNAATTSPAPSPVSSVSDGKEQLRAERRAEVARAIRAKRIMRREWAHVERRQGLLSRVQVDGQDDAVEEDIDDGSDGCLDDGACDGRLVIDHSHDPARPKPDAPNPFLAVVEHCMRNLEIDK